MICYRFSCNVCGVWCQNVRVCVGHGCRNVFFAFVFLYFFRVYLPLLFVRMYLFMIYSLKWWSTIFVLCVVCLTLMWLYYDVCRFSLLNMVSWGYFDIALYYEGYFTNDKYSSETKYMGETVTFFPAIDSDVFNIHDIHMMCRNIGITNIATLHFFIPELNLDDGLCILQFDKDYWDLFEWLSFALKRCIDIYVK